MTQRRGAAAAVQHKVQGRGSWGKRIVAVVRARHSLIRIGLTGARRIYFWSEFAPKYVNTP